MAIVRGLVFLEGAPVEVTPSNLLSIRAFMFTATHETRYRFGIVLEVGRRDLHPRHGYRAGQSHLQISLLPRPRRIDPGDGYKNGKDIRARQ